MKRLITIILLSFLFLLGGSPLIAEAADPNERAVELLPPSIVTGGRDLPTGQIKKDIIPQAITIFLAVSGAISVIVFVYAGIMLVVAQGNEEEITKFKTILVWSLIGTLFIVVSYALVRGVMQLVFK